MATTTWQALNIREEKLDAFPGSTGPATALFHGTIACVNSSGFVEDYTSTSLPTVLGIVRGVGVNALAGTTGDVVTTQGSIAGGGNLVQLITEGKIDSIPFNADLTAAMIGKPVYAIDNYTVTCDPAASTFMSKIGTLTKYYSASKGEFKLNGYAENGVYEKAGILTTSSSSIFMAVINPLGVDAILERAVFAITAAASSAHAVSAGIAATSTTPATDVVITGGLAMGSTGIYGTAKTTNFAGNIYWGATKYLTLSSSSVIGTGSANGTLTGYYKISYKKV